MIHSLDVFLADESLTNIEGDRCSLDGCEGLHVQVSQDAARLQRLDARLHLVKSRLLGVEKLLGELELFGVFRDRAVADVIKLLCPVVVVFNLAELVVKAGLLFTDESLCFHLTV